MVPGGQHSARLTGPKGLEMPDTRSILARDTGSDSGTDLCQTCAHPLAVHDAISLRWCAATKLAASDRACICSGVETEARAPTHY